jgi:hypothetical protein
MVGSENTFDMAGLNPEQQWRLAGGPGTAPGLLQSLAQYSPQTRVAVADNPATYPALLHWLGGLGDPTVSAAVAARLNSPAPPPPPAISGGSNAALLGSGPRPIAPLASTGPDEPTLGVPGGLPVMAAPKATRRRLLLWGGAAAVVVVALVVAAVVFRTVTAAHSAMHVAATVAIGKTPQLMAVSRAGSVYVANADDATVSVLR